MNDPFVDLRHLGAGEPGLFERIELFVNRMVIPACLVGSCYLWWRVGLFVWGAF